ncbi:Reticulocalbin-1 [Durusdinium trenchii]|uniref:Reticulocalbin-1 n=1 Tax=Durusdinium trenchii TaxID=1381693 RepID=A0ABP0MDV7_9DINO
MTELPQHLQRVLLVRHGHRYSTGFDPQLTRRGFFQAEGLAEMFRGSGIEIDAIFSSPFIRCLQTVTPLAKALGLKIRVDRGFSDAWSYSFGQRINRRRPQGSPWIPHEPLCLVIFGGGRVRCMIWAAYCMFEFALPYVAHPGSSVEEKRAGPTKVGSCFCRSRMFRWHRSLVLLWLAGSFQSAMGQDEEDFPDDQDIAEEAMSAEQLRALHKKFDQNGDGKVSLTEVLEFARHMSKAIAGKDVASILEEIDTNKDGKLSLQEHLNDLHQQADGGDEEELKELENRKEVETAKFKAADADKDNVLSPKEVASLFYPETNPAVLDVVVRDTMKLKDKDGDGLLSPKEFWEFGEEDGEEQLSEEEMQDFQKLDKDKNGMLSLEELRAWESGLFHTEAAMIRLIQIADKDGDMQATAQELEDAREELANSDAQYHLVEWAEHNEL